MHQRPVGHLEGYGEIFTGMWATLAPESQGSSIKGAFPTEDPLAMRAGITAFASVLDSLQIIRSHVRIEVQHHILNPTDHNCNLSMTGIVLLMSENSGEDGL